jgi:hypothetical protein
MNYELKSFCELCLSDDLSGDLSAEALAKAEAQAKSDVLCG